MIKLKDILREMTGTTIGRGLDTGDAWPDGSFTR